MTAASKEPNAEAKASFSYRRYVPAGLTLCVGVALSIVAFGWVWNREQERTQSILEARVEHLAANLQRNIDSDLQVLQAISNFYAASKEVDRQEFKTFVKQSLSDYQSIQALEWIPRVSHAERPMYEKAAQAEGFPTFQIVERDNQGKMVRASSRQEYFPGYYMEPLKGNEIALGFDVTSSPIRRSALEKARDTGVMVTTARTKLVQETNNEFGFLVFLPIYGQGTQQNTIADRRQNLKGFVAGSFRVADIVKASLQAVNLEDIDFYLYDKTSVPKESFLAFYSAGIQKVLAKPELEKSIKQSIQISESSYCSNQKICTRNVKVGDRIWKLQLLPTPRYAVTQKHWLAWIALINGLLGTGALVAYLVRLLDRTTRIEKVVQRRTGDLRETLQNLQHTQAQLVQTEKMSALGQLVAGVAHEINNPLNFIYGNLPLANECIHDLLELLRLYHQHYPNPVAEIQEHRTAIDFDFVIEDLPQMLSSMKVGADRIYQIVRSLRSFSRIDEAEMKFVNIHEGIDSTLLILQNRLKASAGYPSIKVLKEYGELPLVECYAGQLNQVFMNLLSNAIDAIDSYDAQLSAREIVNSPRWIAIRTEMLNSDYVSVRIADNGPGMTEEVKTRLFEPFFTTKPVGKGTGLGLSISYQIVVEKHGGTLKCESEPTLGTEFRIEIPIRRSCELPAFTIQSRPNQLATV